MSDLQEQFEMAYRDAQRMQEYLNDKRLLELHTLYKRTRSKSTPREKAMKDYIALAEKLKAEPQGDSKDH